jgi:hypothetical protein
MSSRLAKIGIKNQLREALMKLQGVGLYFKEYKLNEHFMLYINAMNEKKPLPPPLIVQKEDEFTEVIDG